LSTGIQLTVKKRPFLKGSSQARPANGGASYPV
jgi:hypothetical protein